MAVRNWESQIRLLDIFLGQTPKWRMVHVQAKIVVRHGHRMSHVDRPFPSNCQLTRAVELEASEPFTNSNKSHVINILDLEAENNKRNINNEWGSKLSYRNTSGFTEYSVKEADFPKRQAWGTE